jgi:SAM-dependent methyltransferase
VLDIGCGFGDTTQRIAGLVGSSGEVLGVDAAPRFIETAQREAAEAGIGNASFAVMDVESARFDRRFDLAFSRTGTMFFANPVAAMRKVRDALEIGKDLDEAIDVVMSLGPAGEILRLAGERAEHLHQPVSDALRDGLSEWAGPEGVIAPASTWIVTAELPSRDSDKSH